MFKMQTPEELEKFHSNPDPWGYEENSEDEKRKAYLLSHIPEKDYKRVLDIGCGQGYISKNLPGEIILGVDISYEAIRYAQNHANDRLTFKQASLFDLSRQLDLEFDLIIVTGVLYPQYIGESSRLVYQIIDDLLIPGGILVSVHISNWYKSRFPYLMLKGASYSYREFQHVLEVYIK